MYEQKECVTILIEKQPCHIPTRLLIHAKARKRGLVYELFSQGISVSRITQLLRNDALQASERDASVQDHCVLDRSQLRTWTILTMIHHQHLLEHLSMKQ